MPEARGRVVHIDPAVLWLEGAGRAADSEGGRAATCLGAQALGADELAWSPSPAGDRPQLLWPRLSPL